MFKKDSPLYATETERKQGENVLYVNFLGAPFVPSLADDPLIMSRIIDLLTENSNVSRVIFVQQRNYHYPFDQISYLLEIAALYNFLVRQEAILSTEKLSLFGNINEIHGDLIYLVTLLKQDPVLCYTELKRRVHDLEQQKESPDVMNKSALINYLRFLDRFLGLVETTKIVKACQMYMVDYTSGSREIYGHIFRADVLPNFTFTRLVSQFPKDASLIDQYAIHNG